MIPYVRDNKGYRYQLTIIDIFSKYAWAVPVKRKAGKDVAEAMKSVLVKGRVPKNLHTDRDKEFYNSDFQKLMNTYKIKLFSTYSNLKATICERFNRTLKSAMWKKFSLRGNYKWLDILPNLLTAYNNRKHCTIDVKPKDVTASNEADILRKFARKITKKINPLKTRQNLAEISRNELCHPLHNQKKKYPCFFFCRLQSFLTNYLNK